MKTGYNLLDNLHDRAIAWHRASKLTHRFTAVAEAGWPRGWTYALRLVLLCMRADARVKKTEITPDGGEYFAAVREETVKKYPPRFDLTQFVG